MSLLVMKFGGTSVGNATAIAALAEITREQLVVWDRAVVVVSAMSGVTDLLIQGAQTAASGDAASYKAIATRLREKHAAALAELVSIPADVAATRAPIEQLIDEFELLCHSVHVLGEVSPRALDAISGLGERMSARLVAATMRAHGTAAEAVDASEFVITTAHFGSAVPIQPQTRELAQARLAPLLARGVVPVVTGFIGATANGASTTLGRGGSDYSGAIVGAALDADEVAIYTDVDGVMTTDPRLTADARVIPVISYAEMGELAYFGAKVLHPRTIRPVVERQIPLRIRNTFNPTHAGTLVIDQAEPNGRAIKAVTCIKGMSMITVEGRGMIGVPGVAARTFGAVASVGANVLMISQASSEQSICFVVPAASSAAVAQALEDALANELARRDVDRIAGRGSVVIVTAVGAGMRETPGVASQVFGALAEQKINVIAIAQGSSECSISVVIAGADADAAVRAIHALTV
jgi:bifunctional aspartokinase / homoserine dehydrogenase 1